jgi:hypothetical protein
MKVIRWPDGSISRAETWSQMLRDLRREQFGEYSHWGFRRELKRRAGMWSGKSVRALGSTGVFTFAPAEVFMRALAAHELFVILEDD